MTSRFDKLFHPDLTRDNILKTMLAFGAPLLISYIFLQFYNTVDIVVVGHFLGEDSLAAIAACSAVNDLLIGFGNGFGNGLGIVAARAYGAGKEDRLKKIVVASFFITLGVTLFIMLIGHFFLYKILTLLGTPASIIDEAYSYIWIMAIFSGVLFAYHLLSGLLRAIGNSIMPLVFLISSSVLNIFLDILLIVVFHQGVRGTAIATVIAQGISAILCFIYIMAKCRILIPNKKSFQIDPPIYKDLISQGLSMALMSSLVNSGTVILQKAINSFGTFILAGHISARKIFIFTNIPLFTFGMIASTFVSQNYGAQKFDRIKKGVRSLYLLSTVWGIICTIIIPIFSKSLISLISGSNTTEVLNYGSKYISFAMPFYPVLGILLVTRNALQGLGSKILPLISSIIELLGKVLFTTLIIPKAGSWGIILCEPLIWVVMAIQLLIVFLRHPLLQSSSQPHPDHKNQ